MVAPPGPLQRHKNLLEHKMPQHFKAPRVSPPSSYDGAVKTLHRCVANTCKIDNFRKFLSRSIVRPDQPERIVLALSPVNPVPQSRHRDAEGSRLQSSNLDIPHKHLKPMRAWKLLKSMWMLHQRNKSRDDKINITV